MEKALQAELKSEINKIVDMMIQREALSDSISSLKKSIKEEYDIPVTTITKVATIVRKNILDEERTKWEEIETLVNACL